MRKDFKKAGYLLTVFVFLLGIGALVVSSVANYFSYNDSVVVIGELISFVALIVLVAMCVFAKSNYNYVCTRFADYIIASREKQTQFQENEAEHIKQIETMRSAAQKERETAVAAALEQGRNEGAHAALDAAGSVPQSASAQSTSAQGATVQPQQAYPAQSIRQGQPVMPQPRPMGAYMQPITPNDEILYNEYGEPVMIRRRVRRTRETAGSELLYDRYGNPVTRNATNPWETGTSQPVASQTSPAPSVQEAGDASGEHVSL